MALNIGKLVDNEGNTFDSASELSGKIVGLYFSAHWCPPCRAFTPLLAEKYKEIKEAGHPFEIVFVSSDRSEEDCMNYFREMPWKLLSYDQRGQKDMLNLTCNVSSIPTLVLIGEDGKKITSDGRSAIMTCSIDKWRTFEQDKLETARKEAEAIEALPDTITHDCHTHPLVKTNIGRFGCDVCHGAGSEWSFRCRGCDFDAHPRCVLPDLTR